MKSIDHGGANFNPPLTPEQQKLVTDHLYLIDILLIEVAGRKPQPPIIYSRGVKPTKDASWSDDLLSAAYAALIEAARHFNPTLGWKFSTYASTSIRHELWRAKRGGKRSEAMNRHGRLSFDQPMMGVGDEGQPEAATLGALTPAPAPELRLSEQDWNKISDALTPRQLAVLDGRLDGRTQTEIAEQLGISGQAVSSIEKRATSLAIKAHSKSAHGRLRKILRGGVGDILRRVALYPTLVSCITPQAILAEQLRMIYRPDWVTGREWDTLRFKQEWRAHGCNPEKWKFSTSRRKTARPDDDWELLNPLKPLPEKESKERGGEFLSPADRLRIRLGFEPPEPRLNKRGEPVALDLRDKKVEGRFRGLNSRDMAHAVELSYARATHLRAGLSKRGLNGDVPFDQAVVNTIDRDGGWFVIKKIRGGWQASRPPKVSQLGTPASSEAPERAAA